MMVVRATPKMAFCPKLSVERLVVVLRAPFSYLARAESYRIASYSSLLKYCTRERGSYEVLMTHYALWLTGVNTS